MLKKCSGCLIEKSIERFSKNKSKKDGLQTICKDCRKVYWNNHYKNNKQYYIDKAATRKKQIKHDFWNWLSTQSCTDCGISDIRVLEFDHRLREEKEYNIAYLVGRGQDKYLLEEIQKCDIVCANCHRIRTSKQFDWTKNKYNKPH
jgi:L-lysine 2,3-aminomutase